MALLELRQQQLGGFLAGALLGTFFGLGAPVRADAHLDREALGVLGTALPDRDVAGRGQAAGLGGLLDRALVVGQRKRGVQPDGDVAKHEPAHLFQTRIEVDGREKRLQRIGEQRRLGPSAAHLLALAEHQVAAQVQTQRHFVEMVRADQTGLELGEAALGQRGETVDQQFARQEPEDRVAQELELLVVGRDRVRRGGLLVGVGLVG